MQALDKILARLKGLFYSIVYRTKLRKIGKNFKYYGWRYIQLGQGCAVGDNCWFQAVYEYKGTRYQPSIQMGSNVMCSNNVHVSAVKAIKVGNDTLLGSNIYIGDHSHGSTNKDKLDITMPPYLRDLCDIEAISIGSCVWIGDGAIILAGTIIPDGCIVGANSVVKGKFEGACLIAGSPAKIIKRFN